MEQTSPTPLTSHARRGHQIALVFEASVKRIFRSFTIEIAQPEASTNNGRDAVQPIRLVTKDGWSLVIGWMNGAKGAAELHTLGHVLATSKARFGVELAIPPCEYMRYLDEAQRVLASFEISVNVVAFVKPAVAPIANKPETLPFYGLVAGAAVLLAAVAIACGGQVDDETAASTQPLASESTEAPAPEATPPPRGPACDEANACSAGFVCCTGDEPCAGTCVPDCRTHARPCPHGTTCGAEGVCLRERP